MGIEDVELIVKDSAWVTVVDISDHVFLEECQLIRLGITGEHRMEEILDKRFETFDSICFIKIEVAVIEKMLIPSLSVSGIILISLVRVGFS